MGNTDKSSTQISDIIYYHVRVDDRKYNLEDKFANSEPYVHILSTGTIV